MHTKHIPTKTTDRCFVLSRNECDCWRTCSLETKHHIATLMFLLSKTNILTAHTCNQIELKPDSLTF